MTIDRVNTISSKLTILGWFAGLAYYNWFSSAPISVPFWAHLVLIVGGLFASSIVIGGGMALLAAFVTKLATGRADGSPDAFSWAAFISAALAFLAAKYGLLLFHSN
ncbi:MAG TPA: hypothetical protein VF744_04970 [Beijerinckiaceae bacterium]